MADGKFSLDDILNEYSSPKKPADTGSINAAGTSSMSLDDILASYSPGDKSSIIAEADRQTSEKQQAEDEAKKRRQVDYEILSGDYERKYMPDELKTSAELAAERAEKASEYVIRHEKSEPPLMTDLPEVTMPSAGIFGEMQHMKPPAQAPLPEDKPSASAEEPVHRKHDEAGTGEAHTHTQPAPREEISEDKHGKKKVKLRPVKNRFSDDFRDLNIKGIHTADDDDDDFEKKYGSSPLFVESDIAKLDNIKPIKIPFEHDEPLGHSFSEKLEMDDFYSDKYSTGHETSKPKKVTVQPVQKQKPQRSAPLPKPAANPLDKYSAADDVDNIISEYENRKGINSMKRGETSPIRGFTDMFNKLLAKEESEDDMSATGNSELLESIRKLRKSAPANAAPIERKTISDIDLDLSDKMIQDTSQIKLDKNKAELEKLSALKERRSDVVKNFVLMGEEEENTEEEEAQVRAEDGLEDFESLIDAPAIQEHLDGQSSKLVVRLLLLIISFLITAYIALANDLNMPIIDSLSIINKHTQPDVFMFINSVVGVFAGFISYQTVANGMSKLVSFKADCDTLSALSLIASLATSMITLSNSNMVRGSFVYIYTPVAIGALIFNTVGKLLIISRTKRSFKFVSGDNDRYALFIVDDEEKAQDFTHGSLMDFPVLAAMQKTETITDFLKTSYASDNADRFCKIVSPIIFIAAALIGVLAGFIGRSEHGSLGGFCMGLSAFSCCISMCSCFAMMIVVNMPMNKASKKYAENQGAIIGYDSIEEFADTNSIMADASQLFPAGSINLKNIKAFPDTSIDEAIVQAASLTSQSGSILKYMFYDIIVGKTEMLNPVESYMYEDSMGLCGWINNKRVLLGNRELMANHSIEGLPSAAKEHEYTEGDKIAVYLSISGQLSAMFIVELTPSYQIKQALKQLEKNRISVMVRSVDSMISVNRLSEMFDVAPSTFRIIPFRIHPQYEKTVEYVAKRPATLACSGKFAAFANLILGSNRLRGTISGGLIMQAASILLGILLTLTMVLINSLPELTVTKVLLYNFLFVIVFYVYQMFRKV